MTVELCLACHEPIHDQWIFEVSGGFWHEHCLRCRDCDQRLTEKCFFRDGLFYCEEDFHRLSKIRRCSNCFEQIDQGEFYTRVWNQYYHWKCYQCSACFRHIQPGEEVFLTANNRFICHEDQQKEIFHQSRSRKSEEDFDKENSSSTKSSSPKKRGPRTTIKSKQLEQLRMTFATTPKPTRHIREELARTTGLPMRVIQVWFQNRRSKERRMKQSNHLRRQFYPTDPSTTRTNEDFPGFHYSSLSTPNFHPMIIDERLRYSSLSREHSF